MHMRCVMFSEEIWRNRYASGEGTLQTYRWKLFLTWSRVPASTEAFCPRSSAVASTPIEALENVLAFVCSTPEARQDAERLQGGPGLVGFGVGQRARTRRQHLGGCDAAVAAVHPGRAVQANRVIARRADSFVALGPCRCSLISIYLKRFFKEEASWTVLTVVFEQQLPDVRRGSDKSNSETTRRRRVGEKGAMRDMRGSPESHRAPRIWQMKNKTECPDTVGKI